MGGAGPGRPGLKIKSKNVRSRPARAPARASRYGCCLSEDRLDRVASDQAYKSIPRGGKDEKINSPLGYDFSDSRNVRARVFDGEQGFHTRVCLAGVRADEARPEGDGDTGAQALA